MKECDGNFNIFSLPDALCQQFFASHYPDFELQLLMIQVKSRFRSQKYYNAFALINISDVDGRAVLAYCCECYNGLRTVGCCSHVMCLIWFALYVKNRDIPNPVGFLDNYFEKDYELGDQYLDEATYEDLSLEEE